MSAHARSNVGFWSARRARGVKKLLTVYVPLVIVLVFLLAPFYWMIITAFKPDSELYDAQVSPLVVAEPTLDHIVFLLTQTAYVQWAVNTFLVSILSTAISLLLGVPAGYALARFRFRGSQAIGLGIFATYLVPASLLFLPMNQVMDHLHLLGSRWALVVVYPTFLAPFCTWLMSGYFRTIPREIEDCARVDGASRFGAMWRIVLPLATPGLVSAGIFSFTLSWNEFIYALTLVTDTSQRTIPVGVLVELIRADYYFWGPLMAGALLGSIPIALVYCFFVEQYSAGLTAGAVKG